MANTTRKRKRAGRSTQKAAAQAASSDTADAPCCWRTARCSLGTLALRASHRGVRELKFVPESAPLPADDVSSSGGGDASAVSSLRDKADAWLRRVVAYVDGDCGDALALPLDVVTGTAFQQRVWAALRDVPCGSVTTYGDLAKALRSSPRAVGRAVGANPVGIAVPCHRCCGARGALGGFAWGKQRKRALLQREGALLTGLRSGCMFSRTVSHKC